MKVAFLHQTEFLLECEVGLEPAREWVRLSAKCLGLRETRVDRKGGCQGSLCSPFPFLGPIFPLPPFPKHLLTLTVSPDALRPVPQGLGSGACSDCLDSSSQALQTFLRCVPSPQKLFLTHSLVLSVCPNTLGCRWPILEIIPGSKI